MDNQSNSKLYPGIELLRFLASLAVLIWHYQHFSYGPEGFDLKRDEQPLYQYLSFFYDYGFYGVQLFWCISGFIFFRFYLDDIRLGRVSLFEFTIKRFARLYPLHFITLVVVLFLQLIFSYSEGYYFVYQENDVKHFFLQAFLASHWGWQEGFSFNGPIWSVSIEVLVYIVFFFWAFSVRYIWWYFSIPLIGAGLFVFSGHYLFECFLLFYTGGVIAILKSNLKSSYNAFAVVLAFLLIVVSVFSIYHLGGIYEVDYRIKYILIAAIMASIVYVFAVLPGITFDKNFIYLGGLTYSIYLIHFPIQICMMLTMSVMGFEVDYRSVYIFIIYMVLSIFISPIFYNYIEEPYRKRIKTRMLQNKGGLGFE